MVHTRKNSLYSTKKDPPMNYVSSSLLQFRTRGCHRHGQSRFFYTELRYGSDRTDRQTDRGEREELPLSRREPYVSTGSYGVWTACFYRTILAPLMPITTSHTRSSTQTTRCCCVYHVKNTSGPLQCQHPLNRICCFGGRPFALYII